MEDKGRIIVHASAITRDEQLDIARLLVKNGYRVSIAKGRVVNGRGKSFINYERMEENGE